MIWKPSTNLLALCFLSLLRYTFGASQQCVADVVFVADLSTTVMRESDKEAQLEVILKIASHWTIGDKAIRVAVATRGLEDTPMMDDFADNAGDLENEVDDRRMVYQAIPPADVSLKDTADLLLDGYLDDDAATPRDDPIPVVFIIFTATSDSADIAAVAASQWWAAGMKGNVVVFMVGIESASDLSSISYPQNATTNMDDLMSEESIDDLKELLDVAVCHISRVTHSPTTRLTAPTTHLATSTSMAAPYCCIADVVFVVDLSTTVTSETDKEAQMDVISRVLSQWAVDESSVHAAVAARGLSEVPLVINSFATSAAAVEEQVTDLKHMYNEAPTPHEFLLQETTNLLTKGYLVDDAYHQPRSDPAILAFVIFSATRNQSDINGVSIGWWNSGKKRNVVVFMAAIENALDLSGISNPENTTANVDLTSEQSIDGFKLLLNNAICSVRSSSRLSSATTTSVLNVGTSAQDLLMIT